MIKLTEEQKTAILALPLDSKLALVLNQPISLVRTALGWGYSEADIIAACQLADEQGCDFEDVLLMTGSK